MSASPVNTIVSLTSSLLAGRFLHAVVKLGVPEALATGPQSVEQLATALNLKPQPLGRILRLLVQRGFFVERADGRYENNAASDLLRNDHPQSMGPAIYQWFDNILPAAANIEAALHDGAVPFERVFGKPFFDYIGERPEAQRNFARFMSGVNVASDAAVAKAFDWKDLGGVTFADIGGSRGTLLRAVLANAAPEARGVLFDLPGVVDTARREEPSYQPGGAFHGRVELVAGNFFESLPRADVYFLRFILHDWSDNDCVRILRTLRKAIPATARLFVIEKEMPPIGQILPDPMNSLFVDGAMLSLFGDARERTREEFAGLFSATGFELKSSRPLADRNIFEVVPI